MMSGKWWSYLRFESLWEVNGFLKCKPMLMVLLRDVKLVLLPKDTLNKVLIMMKLLVLLYDRNMFAL